jgi:spermidine synthase
VPTTFARPPKLIVSVFFLSGFASLIYQIAWQRLLTLYYGAGATSITVIVSVYMAGLGFGALLGGRIARQSRNPYALYASLQVLLGATGLVSLPCMAALAKVTALGDPAVSLAVLVAFLCVPTALMGATLPVVVDLVVRRTPGFLGSVSRLYSVNTLGAACGAAFTGFVLVSLLGLDGSVTLASAADFALGIVILLGRPAGGAEPARRDAPASDTPARAARLAYPLVFCAGFIAIGLEIVWCRVIGVLVKDSPYAFASVLTVYLLGVALGSHAVQRHVTRRPETDARQLFLTLQFLTGAMVLATFIGYYHLVGMPGVRSLTQLSFLSDLHPSPAIFLRSPGIHPLEDAYLLFDVFLWPLAFMLAPTMLMGASFPLIASVAFSKPGREGEAVGRTYFFNVLGNVVGGLVTGLVLLPAVGSEVTVVIYGVAGLLFGLVPRPPATAGGAARIAASWPRATVVLTLALLGFAAFPRGGALYTAMHVAPFSPSRVHVREGIDAVVVTYEDGERVRNYINGQGHGYRPGPAFLAEAFEGLTYAADPRRVLVVGFGAGTFAEAALMTREAEQVTVVELSRSLLENLRTVPPVARILNDSRLRIVIDDGRQYLQRSGDTFDAILMDPLRTTTAYSNNLHSREFFALARRRLAPDGVLLVGGLDGGPIVPRTLMAAFPHVRAYAYFCLASKRPFIGNRERAARLLASVPDDQRDSIRGLTGDVLDGEALARATAGIPVNRDWRPVSEYFLGPLLRDRLRAAAHP